MRGTRGNNTISGDAGNGLYDSGLVISGNGPSYSSTDAVNVSSGAPSSNVNGKRVRAQEFTVTSAGGKTSAVTQREGISKCVAAAAAVAKASSIRYPLRPPHTDDDEVISPRLPGFPRRYKLKSKYKRGTVKPYIQPLAIVVPPQQEVPLLPQPEVVPLEFLCDYPGCVAEYHGPCEHGTCLGAYCNDHIISHSCSQYTAMNHAESLDVHAEKSEEGDGDESEEVDAFSMEVVDNYIDHREGEEEVLQEGHKELEQDNEEGGRNQDDHGGGNDDDDDDDDDDDGGEDDGREDDGGDEEGGDDENKYDVVSFLKDFVAVDEVEEMFRLLTGKEFDKALFCMCCGFACNTIEEENDPDRLIIAYESCATRFIELITSLPTRAYWKEKLFRHLPANTWPLGFITYKNTLQNLMPGEKFFPRNARYAKFSNSEKKLRFFGSKVWKCHKELRREMNSRLNPHWNKKNLDKSGASESGVLFGIRQWYWELGVRERVSNY
jgi:hypothetical protein